MELSTSSVQDQVRDRVRDRGRAGGRGGVRGSLPAWLTVVGALVVGGILFAAPQPSNPEPVSGSGLGDTWQSTQVERLSADLPSSRVQPAVVVVSRRDGAALAAEDLDALTGRAGELARFADGGQVSPPTVSPDRTVALVAVPMLVDDDIDRYTGLVADLRTALRAWPSALRVEVTGGPAFRTDLAEVFAGADVTLLAVTASVVALLLLITYRSPLLWMVPLAVVAGAEQATLKIAKIVVPVFGIHLDDGATPGITSVLVFGAATDYAFLLIARYRDELRREADRFAAMRHAVRRTAVPVLASGGTVVLAVGALLLSDLETYRALGVACAVGVVLAMVAALVVLPAALALCGRVVFWPFVPRVGDAPREGRIWGRLGSIVARRPVVVAVCATAVLAAMAVGTVGLRTGLSQNEQFRATPEAVRGAQTLARAFPAGTTEPATVLARDARADAVAVAARSVPGVAAVTVAERSGGVARLDVVFTAEPGTGASDRALRQLRDAVAAVPDAAPPGDTASGVRPRTAIVGGQVAAALDVGDANARDRRLLLPLILVLVGAVLVALLRGLLAPVLLVGTVIASFLASLGASWLLFDHVLGFPALDSGVVLLAFVFLVALGVDYNIFLVTRAREDAAAGAGTREGMRSALRVTGGVITSAGVLLAAVFAVLGVLPLITLTQIGIIVCVGVLLDTLVVRTVLVPSLAFMLGDSFWWPGRPGGRAEPPKRRRAES